MAYRIPNKNPIDVGSKVAIGVSIPFNGTSIFNTTYSTQDQIKSNIINFLLTNQGERVLNPIFGASLEQYIFETITPTTTKNLENIVKTAISTEFPGVRLNSVTVTPLYDSNTISIKIDYSIYNGLQDTINIIL